MIHSQDIYDSKRLCEDAAKRAKCAILPENCSAGKTQLCSSVKSCIAARDHEIRVRQHCFCMLGEITPTTPRFCMLECFVSCLSGRTAAADTRPTSRQCSSVVGVGMASVSAARRCNGTQPVECDFERSAREPYCHSRLGPGREGFAYIAQLKSEERVLKHS